jgi:magnesium-transporting ATPase (P-type)
MEGSIFFMFGIDPNFQLFAYFQSLLLLVTSHTFPGFALVFDKKDKSIMQEHPRDSEDILTSNLYFTLVFHAVLMALCVLGVYYLTLNGVIPLDPTNTLIYAPTTAGEKARTMMLITIMLVETFAAVAIRRINKSFWRALKEDRSVLFAFLCIFFFGANLIMYSAPLQQSFANFGIVLNLVTLTSLDWLWCLLIALPSLVGIELWKWAFRRKGIHF